MTSFSLAHLSDASLDRALESAARDASVATAWLLAHLAEADVRRRHVPAGFPSLFEYCVRHLRFSEDAAYKRIRVARAARRFPAIFRLIAAGRLHLSGALLLVPHLTTDNAAALLEAATHRSKLEIEQMLAERFPRPDVPEKIMALGAGAEPGVQEVHAQLAPGPVGISESGQVPGLQQTSVPCGAEEAGSQAGASGEPARDATPPELSARTVESPCAPVPLPTRPPTEQAPEPRPRVTPLAPERYAIQCTVSKLTHDRLRRAQELLGHRCGGHDLATVLDRALELLVRDLEKRRCAAADRPRAAKRAAGAVANHGPVSEPSRKREANPRHVPAAVKRAVWARDDARCTFVSATGRRCEARRDLELDHVHPVARGGRATVGNLRLRCRAHNQHEAECAYGAAFMRVKRESA